MAKVPPQKPLLPVPGLPHIGDSGFGRFSDGYPHQFQLAHALVIFT